MIDKFFFRKRVVYHLRSLIELLDLPEPKYLENHIDFIKGRLKNLSGSGNTCFIYMANYYNEISKIYLLIDEILKFDTSREYRSLRLYLWHEEDFYKKFDGKNFEYSDELKEGKINIKGLMINQKFNLING